MRVVVATAVVFAVCGLLGGTSALAAMPAGGPVHFFATTGNGIVGKITVTGAIGDYGKTLSMTKSGKPDANGNYVKVTMKKGTFEINVTVLECENKQDAADG